MDTWVEVDAKILSIKEVSENILLSELGSMNYFFPRMAYSYQYRDQHYESDVVGRNTRSIWQPEFDSFGYPANREKYFWHGWREGDVIKVYVDPKHPARSIVVKPLERNKLAYYYFFVSLGFVTLSICAYYKFTA